MKLSTRCRYGVRAMFEMARHYKEGPVRRKDICEAQGITHAYLENILIALKAKKLIRTTRGASGGFVLESEPSKISLYDIVTALEGSIAPVECLDNKEICERVPHCAARKAWRRLHEAQAAVLRSITLQDLLDMDMENGELNYAI
jgi:Rrf2 family protein